jgi:hypothetical protein
MTAGARHIRQGCEYSRLKSAEAARPNRLDLGTVLAGGRQSTARSHAHISAR